MIWKYADYTHKVVTRTNEDGSQESCIVEREDVQQYLADGFVIEDV